MPSINFGNFGIIGNKTVSSGLASGLDSKAIIENLYEVKKIPINKIEDNIKINNEKIVQYSSFRQLLNIFKEKADILRNIPSMDKSNNGFSSRVVSLNTNSSNPVNYYLSAIANNDADIGNYEITIDSIAKPKILSSQSFTSSNISIVDAVSTPGKFKAGIFQINGIDIPLSVDQTLADIKSSINAVSAQSNVKANILQVATNDYRLILKSNLTGISNAFTFNDPSNVISNVTFSSSQLPFDSGITINSIPITRSLNNISDVINNVTLNLYQTTPLATIINVDIDIDVEAIKNDIKAFIGAFNDIQMFIALQTERDVRGQLKQTAILGNEGFIKYISSNIIKEIVNVNMSSNNTYKNLRDIGFNLTNYEDPTGQFNGAINRNTIINLDENTLDLALSNNFTDVRKIFEFYFTSSSSSLLMATRSNNISITNFDVTVDTSIVDNNQKAVINYTSASNSTVTQNMIYSGSATSGTITGPKNSVVEDLKMIYVGSGTLNANIEISQGCADRIYNYLDQLLAKNGGFDQEIARIDKKTLRESQDVKRKNEDLEDYRVNLLNKYSNIEDKISKINNTLMMLDAQNNLNSKKN